jgi:hypothetical protein
MKRYIGLLLVPLFLFACSSQPVPDWTVASFRNLERFKALYLTGDDQIAEAHFQKAVQEIKKSGDISLLHRAYLTKYALHVAVLEPFGGDECRQIETVQPIAEDTNYCAFLAGVSPSQINATLLPGQYQDIVTTVKKGGSGELTHAVTKIKDPLSRLIAIGWLIKQERFGEDLLLIASDTASRQGWKKALLAYLDRLHTFYREKKEVKKADAVGQRIRLIRE